MPQLLLVEKFVISPTRLFASLVKLVGPHLTQRQTGTRGHIVTFPQPEGLIKLTELQRLNSALNQATCPRIDNMKEFICVVFIGARIQYEAMVPSLQCQELQIQVYVVYQHLLRFPKQEIFNICCKACSTSKTKHITCIVFLFYL